MTSQYPHGYKFDLFVSYSARNVDWVRPFHDDLRTLKGHQGWVRIVVWSSDGKTLASASGDQTIRLWPGTPPAAHRTACVTFVVYE